MLGEVRWGRWRRRPRRRRPGARRAGPGRPRRPGRRRRRPSSSEPSAAGWVRTMLLGSVDREAGHLRRVGQRRVGPQLDLVDHGLLGAGHVRRGGSERDRGGQAGGVGEQVPHGHRAGGAVALVLEVAAIDHVARPHEPGDGGDGPGIHVALGEAGVEVIEQRGGLGRPVLEQLVGHVRSGHQAGRHRIDRVAPAVAGEVGAGHLEHPGGVVALALLSR